jgi:hypothetical protein
MKTLFLFAALSLAACATTPPAPQPESRPVTVSPTASGVRLAADRVDASTVRLLLDNGSSEPVGYNLCTAELQKQTGDVWARVETGEVCTMLLMTLTPGHDATFEKRLPAGLSPGSYRYVAGVEIPLGTAQTRLATAPFPVQ